jgi:hypothetical protein
LLGEGVVREPVGAGAPSFTDDLANERGSAALAAGFPRATESPVGWYEAADGLPSIHATEVIKQRAMRGLSFVFLNIQGNRLRNFR